MKKTAFILLVLLCAIVQGTWAQKTYTYYDCSWDEATNTVTRTKKTATGKIDNICTAKYASGGGLETNDYDFFVADGKVTIKNGLTAKGDCKLILCDGAEVTIEGGVGNGLYNEKTLRIYGQENNTGKLIIKGSSQEAISGGNTTLLEIHGGEIIAETSETDNAGIRNENDDNGFGRKIEDKLVIFGGKVSARGAKRGAGIGGSINGDCGTVVIHGGTVTARGGAYGAGIGGGRSGLGGDVTVTGGWVEAYGGIDAAGIGSGEGSGVHNGGKLTVTGGYVFAQGQDWGAGIGGGEDASGAEVHILGGEVHAKSGSDAAEKNGAAFGSEMGDRGHGSLDIGKNMCVCAGQTSVDALNTLFSAGERVPACFWRPYAIVKPCTHPKASYTINGTGDFDTHTLKCPNCLDRSETKHTFENGRCTVCGARGTAFTIHIFLPKKSESEGTYVETQRPQVASGSLVTLPNPPAEKYEPDGMEFAGWLVSEQPTGLSSWQAQEGESLIPAGKNISIDNPTYLYARYKMISNITLHDNASNEEILNRYKGKDVNSVTLSGLTLSQDGTWYALCLPFDYSLAKIDMHEYLSRAQVRVMDNENSSLDAATGKLTIKFKEATEIKAGIPFLISWRMDGTTSIKDPVFYDVTINPELFETASDYVNFVGSYSPERLSKGTADDDNKVNNKLYLGSDNALHYPEDEMQLGAFRAYFRLANGLTALPSTPEPGSDDAQFTVKVGSTTNVSLLDAGDNSAVFDTYTGKLVNVSYDRVLKATKKDDGTWASRAYTTCLPYDLDLTAQQEAGQVNVYQAQLIKDNNKLMFTNASPKLEAGYPYIIVVNNGELSLSAQNVILTNQPRTDCEIYNYNGDTKRLGIFRSTFKKIESADAAAMFAYSFQTDGYFKRIRPDTPGAYWGAFRSMFCPDAPAGQDPMVSPMNTNWFKATFQKWLNGTEDNSNPIIDLPADSFEGDSEIPDEVVGIKEIDASAIDKQHSETGAYYDLQGRRLKNTPSKGIYIINGKKVIKF